MLNNVIIMGRMTADPELKVTQSGTSVCSFNVAVDRKYKQGEERQADFLTVVTWKGTAEFVSKYFSKGSMIAVQGRIETRNYEDKNGNKRTAVEIVAENVSFCGSKEKEIPTRAEDLPPVMTNKDDYYAAAAEQQSWAEQSLPF